MIDQDSGLHPGTVLRPAHLFRKPQFELMNVYPRHNYLLQTTDAATLREGVCQTLIAVGSTNEGTITGPLVPVARSHRDSKAREDASATSLAQKLSSRPRAADYGSQTFAPSTVCCAIDVTISELATKICCSTDVTSLESVTKAPTD
jgi:hypothetical protein